MAVQLAQIIGTNIYRKQDAPFYHKGNKVSASRQLWPDSSLSIADAS